ncbi:unnamed protein product, partial [Acidithrix sp. C25]
VYHFQSCLDRIFSVFLFFRFDHSVEIADLRVAKRPCGIDSVDVFIIIFIKFPLLGLIKLQLGAFVPAL